MTKASKKTITAREIFARNVRAVRRLRELSQEGLATEAGVSRSHVTMIEAAQINFSIDTMEQIAHALGLEVRDLLDPSPNLQTLSGHSQDNSSSGIGP
jgi:transcriptional regulator with XRE-family HTH domain